MDKYDIAVVAGDGIGPEVVEEAIRVLKTVSEVDGGIKFNFKSFPWGCEYYLRTGKMMEDGGLEQLRNSHAILLGAVGAPGQVPDHVSLWGLLLPIRKGFQQYANLRPVKLLKGVQSPLVGKGPEEIDFLVVRENTEGEYSGVGGRVQVGTPYEVAIQSNIFTREGSERVIRYAFDLARRKGKRKHLTGVTKSNACNYSMVFWDEVFHAVAREYPDVQTRLVHVDAASMYLITRPESFDVVVGTNLFGDILTDEGAAISGSIGLAPGANLNPEKRYPSMFEPIHGSAPDIAGKGIANPIAAIWSAGMMLDFFGREDLGTAILKAIEGVLAEGRVRTPDLGGGAGTRQMGDAISDRLRALAR